MKQNAVLNIIKQMCSILFPLITFPYAVRILGVEYYGKVNYCNSLITYFSLLAALGMQNYAIREGARIRENKEKLSYLANQLFTINSITAIIAYMLFLLCILVSDNMYDNRYLLLVQSLIIPFSTLGCEWINIIHEDYKYITIRYIILQIISIIAMFLFVHSEADYIIYAAIMTFAQAGAGAANIVYIRKKYFSIKFKLHNIELIKHLKPLLILFGVTLSSYVYINADTTMIGIYRGDIEVGLYSAATKIYNIVKMMISAAMVVTIPRLSALAGEKRKNEYNFLLNKIISLIGIIVIPCTAGLFMLSKQAILIACGAEYMESYTALRILSVTMLISSFSYIFSSGVLIPNKKDKKFFIITIVSAIVNIGLNIIVIPVTGYTGAAITTLISEIIVFCMTFFEAKSLIIINKKIDWLYDSMIGTVAIVIICFVAQKTMTNTFIICIVSIVLSTIAYAMIMLIFNNKQAKEIMTYFIKIILNKKE